MHADESQWLVLRSDALTARINPRGAQLSRLQDAQARDLLWHGDVAFWGGRAPLLFPIVGALAGGQYRWRGRTYALSRHGFARDQAFSVVANTEQSAQLQLRASATTEASYPFPFVLTVEFSLCASTLSLRVLIGNEGREAMPASFGWHPAFRWPLPYGQTRSAHRVLFESDEPGPLRRLDGAGLIEPATRPSPIRGRTLALEDALFAHDALVFDQLRSRSVCYGAGSGPQIRVDFPDTPYLGLWSKPGAPFVCIEPWHGLADPQGFAGEFDRKPGVFIVPGNGQCLIAADITVDGL